MSGKTVVLSDSVCDLSSEICEKHSIKINPLVIVLDDKFFKDGVEIKPDDVYNFYETSGKLPKTTAANIEDHLKFIEQNVPNGDGAVYFTISSELSSNYNNARLAAEEFENIFVIDSRNLSTGMGALVLYASDLAIQGLSAKEIYDKVNQIIDNVDSSFVIDTLEYLHKGGRCSSIAALGANLLKLKPCIQVKGGKLGVSKKYRGKTNDVFKEYLNEKLSSVDDILGKYIFVTHSGCSEETMEELLQMTKNRFPSKTVLVARAGCTVSTHCGPGTFGILFIRNNSL